MYSPLRTSAFLVTQTMLQAGIGALQAASKVNSVSVVDRN